MNRPTPQEDQTPLRCVFCGENAVTTEPRGLVFVARCGFCGARGQVHYTEDEARAEWAALIAALDALDAGA